MATRGKRRLMGEINVVPYIDVMLVLLIIFMVTAPLLTQGIEVELPKAAAEPLDPDLTENNEPLILSVDAEGQFYLNVGDDEDSPRAAAEILDVASAVLRQRPPDPGAGQGGPGRGLRSGGDRHGAAAAGRGGEGRLSDRPGRTGPGTGRYRSHGAGLRPWHLLS